MMGPTGLSKGLRSFGADGKNAAAFDKEQREQKPRERLPTSWSGRIGVLLLFAAAIVLIVLL